MDIIELLPYLVIVVLLVSVGLGSRVRNATSTILPFMEPVSYIFVVLWFIPFYHYQLSDYYPILIAFWVGYLIGYLVIGQVTSEWVGIHNIEGAAQDIYEVVYYEKDGELFLQPQKFKDVCKHVFFGVRWPLVMPVNMVYRRRYVVFHGRYIKLQAHTVDMIEHERIPMTHDVFRIGTYKLSKDGTNRYGDDSLIGQPKYLFHMKCYKDIYKIAPYNTDAPYDFIRKTGIYVKAIKDLADAKLANIDLEIEKVLRTTEGGAIMLSKLVKLTPEDLMMSPLTSEIEQAMREEDRLQGQNRRLQREQAMVDNMEVREDGYE